VIMLEEILALGIWKLSILVHLRSAVDGYLTSVQTIAMPTYSPAVLIIIMQCQLD